MISILVIAVIIIVAVLVNIINKGNRDTSDTAGATIESRADSQVLTESTIDKSNINKMEIMTKPCQQIMRVQRIVIMI